MEPPISSMSCLEIARPNPVPPYFLVVEPIFRTIRIFLALVPTRRLLDGVKKPRVIRFFSIQMSRRRSGMASKLGVGMQTGCSIVGEMIPQMYGVLQGDRNIMCVCGRLEQKRKSCSVC